VSANPRPRAALAARSGLRLIPITLANTYAVIALVFGALFIALTPPFGVGDETTHFERSYETATGAVFGGYGLPAGMQVFIDDAFGRIKSGEPVTAEDFARWGAIDLQADHITAYPDPVRAIMRQQSPGFYPHLATVMAGGVALGLKPLMLLYLGRFASLLTGLLLVRAAIARAPATFRPALLLAGLLPTAIVFSSGVNVESLMIGLAFFYFALIADHAARPEVKLSRGDIALLLGAAIALGQFKVAYFLLPGLAILLPATKFASARQRILVLLGAMLPGLLIGVGWALLASEKMLGGIVYSTAPGNRVSPGEQLQWILAHPLGYLDVLRHTLFGAPAGAGYWHSMLAEGGWTNIRADGTTYFILTIALIMVWASGPKPPPALARPQAVALQLTMFAATAFGFITILYLGWTQVGGPVIEGVQGRYFLPILPLLLAAAPIRLSILADEQRRAAFAIGAALAGLAGMLIAVGKFYYVCE
jgi:hypothetical protein